MEAVIRFDVGQPSRDGGHRVLFDAAAAVVVVAAASGVGLSR